MIARKTVLALAAAAALGTAASLAPAQEKPGAAEKYTMSALSLVVDNCDVICPCLFGNAPTHGHCRNVALIEILDGKLGDVSLAGAKFAMLGEFTGETRKGPTWGYHAFYLDAAAPAPQKEALRKILGAPPFSQLGELLGVDEVAIESKRPRGPLDEWTVKIGDKGGFTVKPIPGGDGKNPQAVENPVYPFPAEKIILAAAKGEFHDHGKDLKLDVNSGEIAQWTFRGEVPAGTVPAGTKK